MRDGFWTLPKRSRIRTQFSAKPNRHTGPHYARLVSLQKLRVSRLHSSPEASCGSRECGFSTGTTCIQALVGVVCHTVYI